MRMTNNSVHASMVYIMTNMEAMNAVIAFYRDMNGMLTFVGSYPNYGKGTVQRMLQLQHQTMESIHLMSEGSLTLSPDGRFLFAVNTGSNSISSFIVSDSGKLNLVDVKPSGGTQPNSIGVFGNLLYVSNVGDPANQFTSNISGFRIEDSGHLTHIPGSVHSLSTINAQPVQIVFTRDGSKMVVPELTTNHLSVFHVNKNGTLTGPIVNESNGMTPFGSYFLSSTAFAYGDRF